MAQLPALMEGLALAMKRLGDRQQVIARNIANADTAGYKARDVGEADFSALLERRDGAVARPRVVQTSRLAELRHQPSTPVILDRDTSETKANGNNVTLEDQLMKLGETQADFAALGALYKKQQSLLKIVLGRSGA